MKQMSLRETLREYGDDLTIAATGAIEKKGRTDEARVIYDGSDQIQLNPRSTSDTNANHSYTNMCQADTCTVATHHGQNRWCGCVSASLCVCVCVYDCLSACVCACVCVRTRVGTFHSWLRPILPYF